MRKLLCVLLMVFASTGCLIKKKGGSNNNGDSHSSSAPVYQKKLVVDANAAVYKAEFVLPMQTIAHPDFHAELVGKDGNVLPDKLMNEGPGALPQIREDGLHDIKIWVPFRITPQNIAGFKVRVTMNSHKTVDGSPIIMETEVEVAKRLYLTSHRKEESQAYALAVFKENAFLTRSPGSNLIEHMHRAMRGDPAADADAEADLAAVRAAWEIDEETLSLKSDALLSFTNPGRVRIKTNGFDLIVIGGDWSKATLEIGRCGQPQSSCQRDVDPDALNLMVMTLKAPDIVAQKIEVGGHKIGAFDGLPGEAATASNFKEICEQTINDFERIPSQRRSCNDSMWHFSGQDIEAHVILESSPLAGVHMEQRDFRNYLAIKRSASQYYISDGKGDECSPETCVFDFDAEDISHIEGVPVPSQSLANNLGEKVKAEPPRFKAGTYRIEKLNEASFRWDDQDGWQNNVSGYSGVWANAAVQNWANSVCEKNMQESLEAWSAGGALPSNTSLISFDIGEEPGLETPDPQGYEDYDLNLSEQYNIWAITNTSAQTRVKASSTNGSFALKFLVRDQQGRAYVDNGLNIQNGVLALQGSAQSDLRPVTANLEVAGFPGGNGHPTANVQAFSDVELSDRLMANLTGKPGLRGDSFHIENFQPGSIKYRYYWQGEDGQAEGRSFKKADGSICTDNEISHGECYLEYQSQQVSLGAADEPFTFKYRARPIVGTYREPYVATPAAEGTYQKNHQTSYPSWLSILGLADSVEEQEDDWVWSFNQPLSFNHQPRRGGVQRGSDPSQAELSAALSFWGFPNVDPIYSHGFAFSCCKRASKAWNRARGAASNPGAAIINPTINPVHVLGQLIHGVQRAQGQDTETLDPIVYRGVAEFFQAGLQAPDGRYEAQYPLVAVMENNRRTLECSELPGVDASQFRTQVNYIPQMLNLNFTAGNLGSDHQVLGNFGVERPFNLVDALPEIQKVIDPVFVDSPLFTNVRSYCTSEKCWTDFDALFRIERTRRCNWEQVERRCHTEERPVWQASRIVWYDNQTEFLRPLRTQCNNDIREKNDNYAKLLKSLANDSMAVPFVKALAELDSKKLQSIAEISGVVSQFQNRYWSADEVPTHLRQLLHGKSLKGLITHLNNILIDSPSRQFVEQLFSELGFIWNDIIEGNLKEESDPIRSARVNWQDLPNPNEIEEIRQNLIVLAKAIEPRIKNLSCKYELKGNIRYYPDALRSSKDARDFGSEAHPKLLSSTLEFIDGPERAVNIQIQNEKVWETTGGETIKVRVAEVDKSPLIDHVRLELPDTALPGERKHPQTAIIGNCQNLGYLSDSMMLPPPRFMFEKPCGDMM